MAPLPSTSGTARRERLRKLCNRIRAIPGARFALYTHTVAFVAGSWSGSHTGDGSVSESETAITHQGQNVKVTWLNDEELTIANLPAGSCTIGPITPGYPDLDVLAGHDLLTGETLHVRITGPNHPTGALYRVTQIQGEKAFHYTIQARPVSAE